MSTLARYPPIKVGLLSIKHPIGSEFHIITHNESLHLTTIGFIIVATIGVFPLRLWVVAALQCVFRLGIISPRSSFYYIHELIKFNRIHFSISASVRVNSGNFAY